MNKVIITGAAGLIGSHVAEYFMSKGISPVCVIRKHSNAEFLKSIGVDIMYADITHPDELNSVFASGADAVIHTAAMVGDWGKFQQFYDVNVSGTMNVLRAAKLNNINNLIITGSVSCFGEVDSAAVISESNPYNSHYNYFLDKIFPSALNYYRDTKAESMLKAKEYAKENNMNLTILHPGWVYGEREFHTGFYDFLKMVKDGMFLLPGSKNNKFHSIYARDLAKIYFLAYRKKLTGVNEFLAVAPAAEYQSKIFNLFFEKAQLKPPHQLPKAVMYPAGFLLELFYTLFKIKQPPPISRGRVNIFYDNIEYSSEKLMRELGFTPDYSLEESIEKTVNWYKQNNYL